MNQNTKLSEKEYCISGLSSRGQHRDASFKYKALISFYEDMKGRVLFFEIVTHFSCHNVKQSTVQLQLWDRGHEHQNESIQLLETKN